VKVRKKEKQKKQLKELNPNPLLHRREQGLKLVKYQNQDEANMAGEHTADEMVKEQALLRPNTLSISILE